MLYISRASAVLEGSHGCVLRNLPDVITYPASFRELRANLETFAWARERSELTEHRRLGRSGEPRTHYRCVLSFERDLPTASIARLVMDWLDEAVPNAVSCAFVHRNTEHVHVHVWIDARGFDGKKLNFSYHQWRSISQSWDRIYCRELKRDERLRSKLRTELYGETRTRRAGVGDRREAKTDKEFVPATRSKEPEACLCASSRRRAIREVEGLRSDLEALVRQRGREGLDR